MQRLLCTRCHDSIHPDTAARNGGLCMPCVRGNMLTIEQRNELHRKRREEEKAFAESPQTIYWHALVSRVHRDGGGFDALPRGEQLYYLVTVLGGEVFNGGFDQFFSNSSGARYQQTVDALHEIGDPQRLQLLTAAKTILFGDGDVPADQTARCHRMATYDEDHPGHEPACRALDSLDRQFSALDADGNPFLDRIARQYGLFDDAR